MNMKYKYPTTIWERNVNNITKGIRLHDKIAIFVYAQERAFESNNPSIKRQFNSLPITVNNPRIQYLTSDRACTMFSQFY